jgi:uncharacterized membrane protein YbhN (UPF0104 family)
MTLIRDTSLVKVIFKYFFTLVIFTVSLHFLIKLNWSEGIDYLKSLPSSKVITCLLLSILNYVFLSLFDVVSFKVAQSKSSLFQIGLRAFIAYAFSMNFGPFFGALGMRFKLYGELGHSKKFISQVIFQSVLSNWLGFSVMAGIFFLFYAEAISSLIPMREIELRLIGAAIMVVFMGIQILVRKINGVNVILLFIAISQWLTQVSILRILLEESFIKLLTAQIISSVSSVVSHIPGGVGIYETIFIRTMGERTNSKTLLGGILGYRLFFYHFPLILSIFLYQIRRKKE